MKLAKETVLTLMQYVDGELAGDDKERAAKLVKEDPDAARFVAELEALSKQVESIVLARGAEVAPDFDVADDVMAAIERDAQEAETKPERVRLVAIAGGAKKTEEAKPAAKPAEPAGRTTEESRFRRIGIVAVATLALIEADLDDLRSRFDTEPDDLILCFTDSDNWRKIENPEYKSNRAGVRKPVAFAGVRDWCSANMQTVTMPYLEADDVAVEQDDAIIQLAQQVDHQLEHRQRGLWQCRSHFLFVDERSQHRYVRRSAWCHPAILRQMPADRIAELGALTHHQVARTEHQSRSLLLLALHRHEAHARTLCCLANRLRIDRIVLAPLHERFDVRWRN